MSARRNLRACGRVTSLAADGFARLRRGQLRGLVAATVEGPDQEE
jgi:hypothetical protein